MRFSIGTAISTEALERVAAMRTLAKCVVLFSIACSSGTTESLPDGVLHDDVRTGTDTATDLSRVLPELVTECSACHELPALGTAVESSALPWSSWLEKAGRGLVRVAPAVPEAGVHLGLSWARRGVHPADALSDGACDSCHPVDAQGIGHGVRAYPEAAAKLAFAGGESCGGTCHSWLPEDLAMAPFGDDGPSWQGSARPADLLTAGDNAHSKLWQEGFVASVTSLSLKMSQYRPGCGGCHNLADESHGAMLSCLDCHKLTDGDGNTHSQHIAIIGSRLEQRNPTGPASACAYCHMDDDYAQVGRAACYNCHLSGHQPLAPTGGAHFW